jgi:4-amino-4-deoxy-L-arabinose transferase-like glycosyltransferase
MATVLVAPPVRTHSVTLLVLLGVGVASDHVHIVVQQRRRGLLESTAMTQVRIRRARTLTPQRMQCEEPETSQPATKEPAPGAGFCEASYRAPGFSPGGEKIERGDETSPESRKGGWGGVSRSGSTQTSGPFHPREKRSSVRWWALLIGAAILLRALVAFVLLGGMPLVSDARDYFEVAGRFASGDMGGPFYWPPGESLVLAPALTTFGKSILAARAVTIAISVASVVLTVLVARELAGGRAARIAGWIAVVYAPSVLLCGQTYSQHLAAVCLAAVAYFGLRAVRERRFALWAAAGAALGLGCLTRPSMISVAPVLAVVWGLSMPRDPPSFRLLFGGATVAICAALALVAPALVHNARAGAGWTVSTNNERNLFLGNNPYTPDYKTSHLGQRSIDELAPDTRAYLESFYTRTDARAAMHHAAVAYMAQHPLRTAWRTLHRATSFWGFDYLASREIEKWRGTGALATMPLLALEAGSYLVVAALALAGLFALGSACNPTWRLACVALMLAYEAPYAIAFSGGTYHFPVVPLLVPFAAVALANAAAAWQRTRASRSTIAVLSVFVTVQVEYAYFALVMRDGPMPRSNVTAHAHEAQGSSEPATAYILPTPRESAPRRSTRRAPPLAERGMAAGSHGNDRRRAASPPHSDPPA